ncbi:MAG: hypothetical protein CMH48_10320 [Muricauda sp.]|nr:YfdX family protein [Allomuricauda sp.]MBC31228.1 hypothetical protein [Allomuricauda sp.]|tara:strand:+ start:61160 stop:62140 length:981 start_codon:yes stop_codon:yes gene_type:complete
MKTILRNSVYMLMALITLTSCAQDKSNDKGSNETNASVDNDEVRMEKPETLDMSKEDLDSGVQGKAVEEVDEASSAIIEEAAMAVQHTYEAIKAINDKDKKAALEALEKATGKLELLVAREPSMALLPVEVATETRDFIADLKVIKKQKKMAEKAIEDDYLQVARRALADMASEVEISTVSVPLATFPDAMKVAAVLLDEDKMEEAKIALYTALNTLVIEKEIIPLPILRAEVMIAAAQSEDAKDEDKKKEVLNLLENAEYQLIMAEELGYGKRDKEYKELNSSIKELMKSVEADGDSQGLFDKLKNKLRNFKNRTSQKSTNSGSN